MRRLIYDAEKHIDIDFIEGILYKNSSKKIFCFGGGTAAEILMSKVLYRHNVECFLDNNKEIQGSMLHGKTIKPPDVLEELEKGSYIVLILSKHVDAISKQLNEMGLKNEKDYFDIYNKFLDYFRIKKFENQAYEFIEFIERIPEGTFDNIPIKNNESIGIVCIAEMIKNLAWYSMAQCLVLRYNGYKSTLIVDTLRSFDSYIYFDGIEAVARIYVNYVVKHLQKKCSDIDVMYIDDKEESSLSEKDIEMTKKYAPVVVRWLDSRRDEVFLPNAADRINKAQELLEYTMKKIKYFFQNNKFNTISVYTGIHRHRCVYTYVGKLYNLRVSTYDGDLRKIISYDTDGVSNHAYDVIKMVNGSYFSKEEKKAIVQLAKNNFEERSKKSIKDKNPFYQFQLVGRNENAEKFDIIIPLNIRWDSSTLGKDVLFKNDTEWLRETLEFIINDTNATVMLREHPAQCRYTEFLFADLEKELDILKEHSERIKFYKADALINTYDYISKCKIVLPYTSTMGIEALFMRKNVITHTNVYYAELGLARKPKSKEDYFKAIIEGLKENVIFDCDLDKAYETYFYQMKHIFSTTFNECFTDWMKLTIEEVNNIEGVNKIVGVIAENTPAIYENVMEELRKAAIC